MAIHRKNARLVITLAAMLILVACAQTPLRPAAGDVGQRHALQLSNGQALHYQQWGLTNTGLPIVLIHGIPDSSDTWQSIAAELGRTHPVYAVDLAGYGPSDWPDGYDLSIRAQAAYLSEFLARLGLREVIVAGHDIGGGVAQILAVQNDTPVRRLILIDSVIGAHWPALEVRALRLPVLGYATFTLLEDPIWSYMLHKGFYDDRELTAPVIAHYRRWYQGTAGRKRLVRNARALNNTDLTAVSAQIDELATPTLMLWGREDRFLDSAPAQQWCAKLRDCRFEFIEHAGHFLQDEQPGRIVQRMREFLQ